MAYLKAGRDIVQHHMPQMLCMSAGILASGRLEERWVRRGARAVWGGPSTRDPVGWAWGTMEAKKRICRPSHFTTSTSTCILLLRP
jgi:hypothetical protein